MKAEFDSMRKNGVWELVNLPQGCRPMVVNGFAKQRETQEVV